MRFGIVSLVFGAIVTLPLAANAAIWTFGGALNSNQEIPSPSLPSNYFGGGLLGATLDDVTGSYSLTVSFAGLTGPATAAHIHQGFIGETNPPLINLGVPTPGDFGQQAYTFNTMFDASTIALGTGNGTFVVGNDTGFYINIHTGLNASGEIRGQIFVTQSPVPLPAAVWLMGSALIGVCSMRRRV